MIACLPSAGCGGDARANMGGVDGMAAAGAAGTLGGNGGSSTPTPPSATAGATGSEAAQPAAGSASGKLTFATIYERVIRARCGQCHNDGPSFGGLAFFPNVTTAYTNLVGVPAGGEATYLCRNSGLMRVQPGDPEHSLIYLKLTMPPCGSKMPPLAFGTISAEQVELVRQWIAEGALP